MLPSILLLLEGRRAKRSHSPGGRSHKTMARWLASLLLAFLCCWTAAQADGDHYPPPTCDSGSCKPMPPPPSPPCGDSCDKKPPPSPPPPCGDSCDKKPPPSPPSCSGDSCDKKPPPSPPCGDSCHKKPPPSPPSCGDSCDKKPPPQSSCECKCKCPETQCPVTKCPHYKCPDCKCPGYKCPDCKCPENRCPTPKCECNCPPAKEKVCPTCETCPTCQPQKECNSCETPKPCDPCDAPPKKCDSCDMMEGVEYTRSDSELMNNILGVELVLSKYYSQAAEALKESDPTVKKLAADFASQTSSHISLLNQVLQNYTDAEPKVDVSQAVFSKIADAALEKSNTNFDAYKSGNNVLLAAFFQARLATMMSIDNLGQLEGKPAKMLVAGVGAELVEQKTALQYMLRERADQSVAGLHMNVAEFSSRLSELQKKLTGTPTSSKTTSALFKASTGSPSTTATKTVSDVLMSLGLIATDKNQ